jgi:hypothetical protein
MQKARRTDLLTHTATNVVLPAVPPTAIPQGGWDFEPNPRFCNGLGHFPKKQHFRFRLHRGSAVVSYIYIWVGYSR